MLLLLLIVITIINFFVAFEISDSVLHPVIILVLIWSCFIFLPVIFWNIDYEWRLWGLLWISLAVFFTEIGSVVGKRVVFSLNKNENCISKSPDDGKCMWLVLCIIIGLGFIYVLISLLQNGFQLADVLSLQGLLNVSSTSASQRYSGTQSGSTLHQILSTFVYLSSVCGGYAYNYSKNKKEKIISISALFPIICEMLFTSGKSGFIACVILWLAGWCVSYIAMYNKLPIVKWKTVIYIVIGFIAFLALLYLVMLMRTGDLSARMRKIISQKFWIYAFGQMVEFDGWFADQKSFNDLNLGLNTYMMIFKTIGVVDRAQGVYGVYVSGYGNVFTAFRGVLSDFGLIGGLLYCFFRGMLTQACYNSIIMKNNTIISGMLLVSAYFWNIYGFIISPWIYTTYVLMVFGFGIFMMLFHYRIKVLDRGF